MAANICKIMDLFLLLISLVTAIATSQLISTDADQLICHEDTGYTTNFNTVLRGIWDFCKLHDGHHFREVNRTQLLVMPYGNTSSISYMVQTTDTNPSTCNYTLDVTTCVVQLTTAVEACNDFPQDANSTVANGGMVIDPQCGWHWQVELGPELPSPIPLTANITVPLGPTPTTDSLALRQAAPTINWQPCQEQACWTKVPLPPLLPEFFLLRGIDVFCGWVGNHILYSAEGLYFTYTLSGDPMQFQIWTIDKEELFTYDSCELRLRPLVYDCLDDGQSRGGYCFTQLTNYYVYRNNGFNYY